MNCRLCRDELLLHVGQQVLPDDLVHHLDVCAQCREVCADLKSISARIARDDDFLPFDVDADEFVADVEKKIARATTDKSPAARHKAPSKRVAWVGWQRYLPVAAAVLLVIGISLIGYRDDQTYRAADSVESGATTATDEPVSLLALYEGALDQFDEAMLEVILSDFGEMEYLEASELLLDDLSDEELQYLRENFDVGEIL